MIHRTSAGATKRGARRVHVERLRSALNRMIEALEILDEGEAPGYIGAQLDLAIARLKDEIARTENDNSNLK